jgi:hypothetical protein
MRRQLVIVINFPMEVLFNSVINMLVKTQRLNESERVIAARNAKKIITYL